LQGLSGGLQLKFRASISAGTESARGEMRGKVSSGSLGLTSGETRDETYRINL
jgi:hypothetical protein